MLQALVSRFGRRLLVLPCLYMAMIFTLSQIPGSKLPKWNLKAISLGDILHFPTYFGLGFLWLLTLEAWPLSTSRSAYLAIAFATAFGIVDEFHQSFVTLRTMDPWDAVVNFAGALTAALTWCWTRRAFFSPEPPKIG